MKIQQNFGLVLQITAFLLIGVVLFDAAGCSKPETQESVEVQQKKLPKLKFHRPKSVLAVGKRLDEICKALQSEEPVPEPIQFTVIELVHGEGSSSHSHYYLAKSASLADTDKQDDGDHEYDDHGGMKSVELTHQLEIDIFTELSDVIRWLPNIAAGEGIKESEWLKINGKVQRLEREMLGELGNASNDSAKRLIFRKHGDLVKELENLLQATSERRLIAKPAHGDKN